MTKSEFILSLSEALAHLPGRERERVLSYFEEMIDDRIEGGMTEEDAVAAMGSIEDILKEAAPEALSSGHQRAEANKPQPGKKSFDFSLPIEGFAISSGSAKLNVRSAELSEGLSARVEYTLSENEECLCTLENGTLSVQYSKLRNQGFSLRNLFSAAHSFITITLKNPAMVRGEIGSASGDVHLNGLVFTDCFKVGTASGDIKARDIAVHSKCTLHTASGDIEARNLTCGDLLDLHTASGDMDLFDIRAGKVSVGTASGDPTLGSIECDELEAGSASGDIDLRNVKAGKTDITTASGDLTLSGAVSDFIEMNSASGDIEIRSAECTGEIHLSSNSGDIHGSLTPADDYTFSARSRTGDVRIPQSSGRCIVEIDTHSGDISF